VLIKEKHMTQEVLNSLASPILRSLSVDSLRDVERDLRNELANQSDEYVRKEIETDIAYTQYFGQNLLEEFREKKALSALMTYQSGFDVSKSQDKDYVIGWVKWHLNGNGKEFLCGGSFYDDEEAEAAMLENSLMPDPLGFTLVCVVDEFGPDPRLVFAIAVEHEGVAVIHSGGCYISNAAAYVEFVGKFSSNDGTIWDLEPRVVAKKEKMYIVYEKV
jgi:hypothetical protein